MADAEDKPKPARPTTSRSSTAASRAGKRRVTLPSSDSSPTASSTPKPKSTRKAAPPRPFYRRAGFWFLVIVAEGLAALTISYKTPSIKEDVSIEGGDLAQFCSRVNEMAAVAGSAARLDVATAPNVYRRQAADYRRLAEVAPTDVVSDINTLAGLTDEMTATADGILEHKNRDATYQDSINDLASAEGGLEGRIVVPFDRLRAVVLKGCGVDITEAPPTTTTAPAVPGGSVPAGSVPPGSAPASVPPAGGSTTPPTTPSTTSAEH
jgi:hypothetical protein